MSEKNIKEEVDKQTAESTFNERYNRVLEELRALDAGQFDDTEAKNVAALCLRAQLALSKAQTSAEARGKALKKNVEFEKASAYLKFKKDPPKDLGKMTEATLNALVNSDEKVNEIINQQIEAERQAKDYTNILNVLANAHVTFRTLIKKGE